MAVKDNLSRPHLPPFVGVLYLQTTGKLLQNGGNLVALGGKGFRKKQAPVLERFFESILHPAFLVQVSALFQMSTQGL